MWAKVTTVTHNIRNTDDIKEKPHWAMIDLGYNLSKNEAEEVVNYFDKSGSGKLNYDHLIAKLQVSLLPAF